MEPDNVDYAEIDKAIMNTLKWFFRYFDRKFDPSEAYSGQHTLGCILHFLGNNFH